VEGLQLDDVVKETGVAWILKHVVMKKVILMVRVMEQTLVLLLALELFYVICSCARKSLCVGDEISHLHSCLLSAAVF
jgi:hypothetical protein